MQLEKVNLQ